MTTPATSNLIYQPYHPPQQLRTKVHPERGEVEVFYVQHSMVQLTSLPPVTPPPRYHKEVWKATKEGTLELLKVVEGIYTPPKPETVEYPDE